VNAMGKIIVADDIPDAMKAEIIAEEVIVKARADYNLRKLCRIMTMDTITGKVPVQTNLAGQEKVPELTEAKLSALSFTQVEFDMWKNVVHVAVSKEAELRSKQDLMQLSVMDAGRDVARMENKQIAEMMDGATALTGADWSNDANSPMKNILEAIRVLGDAGYKPQYLALPNAVYEAFAGNALVVQAYMRGATVEKGMIPGVLGLEILVDQNLTNKQGWVVDQRAPAFALGDGPELVTKYPGGPKFYDGYAIGDFLEPKLVIAEGSRRLTGLLP